MSKLFRRISTGFTVVELSVVIAVIAILVAVTTTIYTTTQRDAADRSVQSDLVALSGVLSSYVSKNGEAKSWYSPNGIDSDLNFTPSSGNVIDVTAHGEEFCIRGYNPRGSKSSIEQAFERGSTEQSCVLMDRSTAAGGTGGTIVGWWKLNNDAGRDYSGFGNTASAVTSIAAAIGQNGRANNAYAFNGVDSQLEIPHSLSLDLTGPLTMSAWIRPADVTRFQGIIIKDVGGSNPPIGNPAYELALGANSYVLGRITNSSNVLQRHDCTNHPLVVNQWVHAVQTFDGSKIRTYVNGTQCSGDATQTAPASTPAPLRIGKQKNGFADRNFAGDIDDVRVYNYALSAEDIAEMYAKGAQ